MKRLHNWWLNLLYKEECEHIWIYLFKEMNFFIEYDYHVYCPICKKHKKLNHKEYKLAKEMRRVDKLFIKYLEDKENN